MRFVTEQVNILKKNVRTIRHIFLIWMNIPGNRILINKLAQSVKADGTFSNVRTHAISSMVGLSGYQKVHEKYLEEFRLPKINPEKMDRFDLAAKPIFETVKWKALENQKQLEDLLLSKLATMENQ